MERIGGMPVLFLLAFRFIRLLLSGHQAVAIENAALRMQIAAFPTKTEAPVADKLGPGILDHSPQPAVRLATSPDLRPGRYCRPLAARTLPQILGQVVQAAAPAPRSPPHRRRTPPIDRANGRRQSALARAQDSRRTQNARHRDLRAHCFPYPAQTPSPAESDLEDLPAQPCRSHRVDRFLYSADHHDEGVVRIRCPGT